VIGAVLFAVAVLLPPPAGLAPAAWRAAAVGLLMAAWWLGEALPIPATALLPAALFPLLGVTDLRAATAPYANPLIFLFLGGFLIALAMERWQLHRRLALEILARAGGGPSRIAGGFMAAAALLSMWISNTATAMMMLPIARSVVELAGPEDGDATPADRRGDGAGDAGRLAVVVMLGIAYACSLGGLGTLIGTPTNAFLAGFLDQTWGVELSFARWLLIGLPVMVIGLLATFVLLTRVLYPLRRQALPGGAAAIARQRAALGRLSAPQARVALVFALVALLWIGRPLAARLVPGLSDPGIAVLGALAVFLLPAGDGSGERLLDWESTRRLPWGVLLLFGGGLSLASAIQSTGLAAWLGGRLAGLAAWPPLALVAAVVAVIVLLTELTSNTATAAAFLPVLASLAVAIGEHPFVLLVPATLAASCAFMLPVATPPNAIVYGSGHVSMAQMARAGLWLNLVMAVVVSLLVWLLLPLVFDVAPGQLPAWATPR